MTLNGFKKFIIEDMNPNPEKSREVAGSSGGSKPETQDYFDSLEDEQGIGWEQIVKSLETDPNISAHFQLGKGNNQMQYKLSAWEVVPGSMTPEGADIRIKHQDGERTYLKGHRLNQSNYKDNNRYHLNRDQLIKFLTTGWTPAVIAAQSGGGDMGGGLGGGM